jgi:mannose-6-phosphate isomerase class I
VTQGEGVLRYSEGEIEVKKGDTLFIPAQNACFEIVGNLEMIESKVN